ncbi:MAG: hypothetical protein ACRDJY_07350 [Thermoleophilaceae bacterium]
MTRFRALGLRAIAALVAGVLAFGALSAPGSPSPHAAAVIDVTLDPTVRFNDRDATPGEVVYTWGADWLPQNNCDNRIRLKLRDSSGDTFSLGSHKPANPRVGFEGQEYPAALDATPTVPDGVRPGTAKVWGKQEWAFKFPGFGCFELAQITSDRRSITILGESGNDPPRITGFDVANLPQGGPGTIKWTASEPCAATVEAEYLLAPGMKYDLPAVLTGHPSVAGANTASYDATSEGRALPTGEYRAFMQCQEANGAKSSISRDTFVVGFAP